MQTLFQSTPLLKSEDFEFFRSTIFSRAGIRMADAKVELVQSRLRTRLQELNLDTYGSYRAYLEGLPDAHAEWQLFINCLTTNKTDWFREPKHFDFIASHLIPQWKKSAQPVSVWSAACSTGEEPYSIAALLERELKGAPSFRILGTDIDTDVLALARNGVYPRARIDEIAPPWPVDFVAHGTGEIASWVKVRSALKKNVSFEPFNLLSDAMAWPDAFDLILCRNVLIYFSKETTEHVVNRLYEAAAPGAILMIGHSESLQGLKSPWKLIRPSIFQKKS